MRKARDQLEPRPDQRIEPARIERPPEPKPVAPTINSSCMRPSIEALDARGVMNHAHVDLHGGRADPRELRRVEAGAALPEQRREHGVARDDADGRAVAGRDRIEVVGGVETAGAENVLRDHGGPSPAGGADMARERAAPQIVAAAGAEADRARRMRSTSAGAGLVVELGHRVVVRRHLCGHEAHDEAGRVEQCSQVLFRSLGSSVSLAAKVLAACAQLAGGAPVR